MEIGTSTRVLVTGASRGIGTALAHAFAVRGCELGLLARSEQDLAEATGSLPGTGHVSLTADVADRDAVRAAVERFGRCDVAVANAGVAEYGPFRTMDLDAVERMTRVNWLGTVYTVAAVLPGMLGRRHGHIVVVSSGAGLRSFPGAAVYGATKHAQKGFAEALRHELSGTGVSVTIVYPGEIESHLHDHQKGELPDWYDSDNAVPAEPLAAAVVEAVERDRRAVYHPPLVRSLRVTHGISPRLADLVLRRVRGPSAAPRRR